jgi:small GTP-binding protein
VSAVGRRALKVAVVGHTNTGKTSLLRTLTHDASFGEVCDRPGTTRHVEETLLLLDGAAAVELYDTPGMEDSIGLLEHIERARTDRRDAWVDVIRRFLDGPDGRSRFEQEAKALRQVLASDVVLYVIDARDRVLGKHRDELEILARCARPVVPVLNFVAGPEARSETWRQDLTRLNLHAVAEFDTVVLNETGEQRLFEKMLTLLDAHRPTLTALIADRRRRRAEMIRGSAELIAELLIDVAAFSVTVDEQDDPKAAEPVIKQAVRDREQACVDDLLQLFRFRPDDYEADAVPVEHGRWDLDLFSPAALRRFGIRAGGAAAAGGLAGLAIDAMTGGLSLGAAAALGATLGAAWGGLQEHGRRLADVFRGFTRLRIEDATLRLLAAREIDLVQALLRRGHASQDRIRLQQQALSARKPWATDRLPDGLEAARQHPEWSSLNQPNDRPAPVDARRLAARDSVKALVEATIAPAADA